ncbi:unnamed protein product [Mytilus edulis]|uniref:Metalloendopeptidase n=1 Tax=Mytilus edulis TaxID=6550 RepID=A0A8S3UPJ3_MYTED|nr:unnamed protein product [Mytilus edulis]
MYYNVHFTDEKPYWWDIKKEYVKLENLVIIVKDQLKNSGNQWVDDVKEDVVAEFTKGKYTMNVNQDSTLAKMIESMIIEVNGQDKVDILKVTIAFAMDDSQHFTGSGYEVDPLEEYVHNLQDTHVDTPHKNFDSISVRSGTDSEVSTSEYEAAHDWQTQRHKKRKINISPANTEERKIIETAIEELARKTCIQLVPKGSIEAQGLSHTTYIEFIDLPGCWSYVGRNPSGVQHISLQNPGCVDHSTVQHEILHALGMWHEQNRLDRDNYIKILKENVTSGNEFNFDKKKTSDTRPYDAESVMQYSLYSFGKTIGNTTAKTMEFVDKNLEFLADLDAGLDFYDVADITDTYQCAAHCKGSSRPKCENGGFVDHNCECFCPSACGGIVYVSESKVTEIRTPNWPSPYPVGTKCTWLIKAPADMYIKLIEEELSLPYNTLDRCYHWMEVRTWSTTPSGESNLMMVRFDAKFAEDRDPWQGFRISATAFSKDSNPTTLPSDSTPTTLPTTLPSDTTPTTLLTILSSDSTPTTLPTILSSDSTQTTLPTIVPIFNTYTRNWTIQSKRGQYYSYMESSHPAGSTGQELTATFVMRNEISEAKPRCLSFYYSMHGATMGSLEVYRKGTGIPKDLIFIKKGEQGNQWNLANISILPASDLQGKTLSAYTGPSRAHSGQFYAYLEASYRPMGGTAVMTFKVPPMGMLLFLETDRWID